MNITGEMVKAFQEGCSGYVPVFDGRQLAVEGGFPDVSLANLLHIIGQNRGVLAVLVGQDQNVLVVFTTGETYLATGFGVGHKGPNVADFAKFIEEIGWGGRAQVFCYLASLQPDYRGPLTPDLWNPRAFRVTHS